MHVARTDFFFSAINDSRKRIIDRTVKGAAVEDHFIFENEHGRLSVLQMLHIVVSASAQDVQEDQRTLPCIHVVFHGGGYPAGGSRRIRKKMGHGDAVSFNNGIYNGVSA
jgi:hypothetical protein